VGGDSRIAGFMLALATFGLMAFGLGAIKFIRTSLSLSSPHSFRHLALKDECYVAVMVVGALIFVLGIDLMKEALWDTRHRVSRYDSFPYNIMVQLLRRYKGRNI